MKLLTREVMDIIPGMYQTEKLEPERKMAVVKFFNPVGVQTWYVFEATALMEDGRELPLKDVPTDLGGVEDIYFFCYAEMGMGGDELGDVSYRELMSYTSPYRTGIERDLYWQPKSLQDIRGY